MKISFACIKNRLPWKPNEDNIFIDDLNNIFLVVDGVSRDKVDGIYPNPSPAALITDSFVHYVKMNHKDTSKLTDLFCGANIFINKLNTSYEDFKPGLVGVCIKIQGLIAEWVSIGDCIALVIRDKTIIKLNYKQTEKLRTSEEKFDSKTIRNIICNNPNHPLSYGVIDGNPNAEWFIETGKFELRFGDKLLLFSDGLEMLLKSEHTNILLNETPEKIIELSEEIEIADNIRSDDKTLIKIEL